VSKLRALLGIIEQAAWGEAVEVLVGGHWTHMLLTSLHLDRVLEGYLLSKALRYRYTSSARRVWAKHCLLATPASAIIIVAQKGNHRTLLIARES
jgi:hypothetical protein